jgi:NAD(P)-dependent dehydrogenase (short-subunit alcohol dehydrogenase family)
MVDRSKDALTELARDLTNLGKDVAQLEGDVSQAQTAKLALDLCLKRHQRIDILVNNAGINPTGTLAETDEAGWENAINVNRKSAYSFCHEAIPQMKKQSGGVVVNLASIAGLRASNAEAVYSISKAGMIMLSRTIARDFGKSGIRANALCPSVLEAIMVDRKTGMNEDEIQMRNARFIPTVPMQRLGTYDEIVKCILFLASDDASYVNGAQLVADGGLLV